MKIKIINIVGARPQFIKAAMISRAIAKKNATNSLINIKDIILHTDQHYDYDMSQVFFDQLKISKPKYHLRVGSGTHGKMTGLMIQRIEEVLIKEKPDWAIVYGDTNTTLAGALAAVKLHIPIAHVEAGLRSFNRLMPEEINRILTDHISHILFSPSQTAVKNLKKEGIVKNVYNVGDVMNDAFLQFEILSKQNSKIISELNLDKKSYCLITVHRQENTSEKNKIRNIFSAFNVLASEKCPFIITMHPRTRKCIQNIRSIKLNKFVKCIDPVSYLDMIALETSALLIMTDSGGVQKEAYFSKVPCITLRNETEWIETVESKWNYLAGTSKKKIIEAFYVQSNLKLANQKQIYGSGTSSEIVVKRLISTC